MANLKNIAELPLAESADGLNLIVNDNGSAKQIAASAVGAQADFAVTDETSPAFIKNKPVVVQSDWNQSDETAPDYIKNRPLYSNKIWEVVHEEQEIIFDYGSSAINDFTSGTLTADPHILSGDYPEGTECKVVIDGEEHIATINKLSISDNYIGNGALVKGWTLPDTGESFFVGYWGVNQILIVTNKPAGTYKVSMSVLKGKENKLDPKYLPDAVQVDWNQNDETAPDYVKNRPFYEDRVETALFDGDITLIWKGSEFGRGYCYDFPSELSLVDGTIYTVKCNDKSASIVCEGGSIALHGYNIFGQTSQGFITKSSISIDYPDSTSFHLWIGVIDTTLKTLDPKYLPDSVANRKPLILDANLSDYYGGHPEAGDEALEAIKTGRQILVRVPNADGGTNTAIYCPIMMHQVPLNGYYLYLFYLRDEKQDLSALLGQPAGTVLMPTYGQFKMLLSKNYDSNPIESIE